MYQRIKRFEQSWWLDTEL